MIMTYATVEDVQDGMIEVMTDDQRAVCAKLLEEASVIIDAYAPDAPEERKKVVSCRLLRRVLANTGDTGVPLGATQGTMTAGNYSQSFTFGSTGSVGEMWLDKYDKKLLGCGNRIGSHSPLEDMGGVL